MLAEVLEDSSSPPDKPSSPPSVVTVPYSSSKSTGKIYPNPNSRASKKPCKYIRAKQTCPFGVRCHFSHDTPQVDLSEPLTRDEGTHSSTSDRRWRNKPRPPQGPRPHPPYGPSPDDPDALPPRHDHHRRPHPPRNRQNRSHSKSKPLDSKQSDLRLTAPKPATASVEEPEMPHSESKESRSDSKQLKQDSRFDSKQLKPHSEVKQPPTDTRKSKQGPSELNLGSFLTPSFNRPPVQRPKPKKAVKSSTSELREVRATCIV